MPDPFLGMLVMFGCNFSPRGWAFCHGQILSIAQNTALFSLLGTMYGGNGTTTFALPDLRGRVPIGQNQGPGLSNYTAGEVGGSESLTLISTEIPMHNHAFSVIGTASGTVATPENNVAIAKAADVNGDGVNVFNSQAPNVILDPRLVSLAGGSQPHNNLMPFLTINYCIALEGIYPSRN